MGLKKLRRYTIVDVLRRAEINVIMISVSDTRVSGSHKICVGMDTIIQEISAGSLDAVVLPGGMAGSENSAKNSDVIELLQDLNRQTQCIGTICAVSTALNSAGIISDKQVTCYPSFESKPGSANCTGNMVMVDGNIVTGKGPGAAIDFSLKLVYELGYPGISDELADKLLAVP